MSLQSYQCAAKVCHANENSRRVAVSGGRWLSARISFLLIHGDVAGNPDLAWMSRVAFPNFRMLNCYEN